MEGEDDEVMPDITPIPPPLPMPLAALTPWGTWGSSTSSSHRLMLEKPHPSGDLRRWNRLDMRGKRAHDIHCMVSIYMYTSTIVQLAFG